ncbi:MAG: tetratricopeptide repeat protein [Spirochaetales bacterium]|jgi:tetratricopeptide (TPR) repeat protein|nr:tetratricopeptide repeat protein [Spirochaetales bacterium]
MTIRILGKIFVLTLLLSFSIFLDSGVAESFPFRSLAVGEKIPDGVLVNSGDQSTFSFRELQGKPVVLVFWGGDLEVKKQRSIAALTELQGLAPFLAEKNIVLKLINAQGDSQAVIDEVIQASGFMGPVYLDPEQKVYGTLGVFIMPAVLLLDENSVAVAGTGYSKDMTASLKGEVEILLGEKTPEQVEAELHPVMVEKPKAEVAANRHLHMGNVLASKGQLEEAQREFKAAIEKNPSLAEAFIELGCLYYTLGEIEEAAKSLDTGLVLNPDSLRGEVCFAQVTAAQGDVDGALDDLKAMLFRNSRNAELHYVLGTLYDKKGDPVQAAAEYSKAYELLLRSTHFD